VKLRALAIAIFISLLSAMSADLVYAKSCPDGLQMQQYRQQREALVSRVRFLAEAGAGEEAIEAVNRLNKFNAKYPFVFLNQEIKNFPLIGDVACLFSAMRTASGQDLNYQPYSDGTLDLLLNGKRIRERISAADLLAIAKTFR
jgi:hypothetical protein